MGKNEDILAAISRNGPSLPAQIAKEINEPVLMAAARLSELSSKHQLKISNLKVGSSPLYYAEGQQAKLTNFSENLNDKAKKAFDMLRQEEVLRDTTQEPVIRVALREIKDFAIPLNVSYNNQNEIFWKWYLVDTSVAQGKIKGLLDPRAVKKPEPKNAPTIKKEETKIKQPTKQIERPTQEEKQQTLEKKPIEKVQEKKPIAKEDAHKEIYSFFQAKNITITETIDAKKKTEASFMVTLPTPVGSIKHYCVAKYKKRINEGDISSALIQAQSQQLPLLFITKGELTKKAGEMMQNEFRNVTLAKLG